MAAHAHLRESLMAQPLLGRPDPTQTLADGLVAYFGHVAADPIDDLGGGEPAYVRASSAERLWKS